MARWIYPHRAGVPEEVTAFVLEGLRTALALAVQRLRLPVRPSFPLAARAVRAACLKARGLGSHVVPQRVEAMIREAIDFVELSWPQR